MPQIQGAPAELNELLEEVYASAIKTYNGDEEAASKTAFAAAEKAGWHEGKDGKWQKKKELEKSINNVSFEKLNKSIHKREDVNPQRGKEEYGDVEFADERNKKYPINDEGHIRAAWNYINKEKNAAEYSAEDVSKIKAKIIAAWKKKINKAGPPSAVHKSFFFNFFKSIKKGEIPPKIGDKKMIDGKEYIFLETTPNKPRWHSPEEVEKKKDEGNELTSGEKTLRLNPEHKLAIDKRIHPIYGVSLDDREYNEGAVKAHKREIELTKKYAEKTGDTTHIDNWEKDIKIHEGRLKRGAEKEESGQKPDDLSQAITEKVLKDKKEGKSFLVGAKFICNNNGRVEIYSGSDAKWDEVHKGDTFTVTKDDDNNVYGTLNDTGHDVIFYFSKKSIAEEPNNFWATFTQKQTKKDKESETDNLSKAINEKIIQKKKEKEVHESSLDSSNDPSMEIKEPWQMTREEFEEAKNNGEDVTGWNDSNDRSLYKDLIERADFLEKEEGSRHTERAKILRDAAQVINDIWNEKHDHQSQIKQAISEKRPFAFDPNSTENEGRFRLLPSDAIQKDSYFRTKSKTDGISFVKGKLVGSDKIAYQAIRFDKNIIPEDEAGRWWENNRSKFKPGWDVVTKPEDQK